MDDMTKEQRHKNMQHIKATDTKAEKLLRLALWHRGFRYRKNWKKLPGKPDIVLTKQKIAIFVDGDFWHARNHQASPGEQVGSNKPYWTKKLANNVARDKEVNNLLSEQGYVVLRFWETDVKKDLEKCLKEIFEYIVL